jgi:hypothetical protein
MVFLSSFFLWIIIILLGILQELEEYHLLGYNAMESRIYPLILRGMYGLHLQCRRVSQTRNQSEAGSNQSCLTTWHHTPKDGTLHSHRYEHLKSYNSLLLQYAIFNLLYNAILLLLNLFIP